MKKFVKINAIIIAAGFVLFLIGTVWLSAAGAKYFSGNTVSYEENLSAKEILSADKLEIETGFAEMEIVTGSEVKLTAENIPEGLQAHLSCDNNTIKVSSGVNYGGKLLKNAGINVNSSGKYTLCVPESLSKIDVEFGFGKLTVNGLSCDKADFEVAYSDADIYIAASKLDIDNAFGDTYIDMMSVECSKADISSSFGQCRIENAWITEAADIDSSFGEVSCQLIGDNYRVDSDNSFGDCTVSGDISGSGAEINVSNSFGDTKIIAGKSGNKII